MDRQALHDECTQKAAEIWEAVDDNERAAVRVGMLPAHKMNEAINDILSRNDLPPADRRGVGRLIAVALMDRAKADGGMVM